MRAMILCAGLGTRLRPLTLVRPKALVPLMGATVLEYWIERLSRSGCEAVVLNAFHLHEKLHAAVRERRWPIPVHVKTEPVLLGTGGGIRKVLDFFEGEPFVVINGDTLCDVDLGMLYRRHLESGCPASLLMHDLPAFNNVAVSGAGEVLGFGKEAFRMKQESNRLRLLAFTGIHVIDPGLLQDLPSGSPADILASYRKAIQFGRPPQAVVVPDLFWREMGSVESYRALVAELGGCAERALPPFETGRKVWVHPTAQVEPGARFEGLVVVGRNSVVRSGAELEDVMLWDSVQVNPKAHLHHCIVTDGRVVDGTHRDEILIGEQV